MDNLNNSNLKKTKAVYLLAVIGLCLAVIFALAAVSAGVGTRWNLWYFRTGLSILRYSAYGSAAAVLISLIAITVSAYKGMWRVFAISLIGFLIGSVVFTVPYKWSRVGKSVPPIHDITTDTEDPPQFSAIVNLRKDAQNPVEYDEQAGALQRAAYSDIAPVMLAETPEQAFERALKIAMKMGWEIVGFDRGKGLIEATDTTFWFGFKDDIVIRVRPDVKGSRVDIRSISRVGKSDMGTNARRIRNFAKRLST